MLRRLRKIGTVPGHFVPRLSGPNFRRAAPPPWKLLDQLDYALVEDQLHIEWSDGEARRYTVRELRERCPCATCREKRNQPPQPANPLQVLSPAETRPLKIAAMKPVGNYAYAIDFSDGHDTGIYTLEFLRTLGVALCAERAGAFWCAESEVPEVGRPRTAHQLSLRSNHLRV